MRKFIVALAILLPINVFAQVEKVVFPTTIITADPTVMAGNNLLGGVEAYAAMNNPAQILMNEKDFSVAASYRFLGDINTFGAGFAMNFDDYFGLSLGYRTSSHNNIPKGTYNPREAAVSVGLSFCPADLLFVGASINVLRSYYAPNNTLKAFAFDIGLTYSEDAFYASVAAKSLAKKPKEGGIIPSRICGALSYNWVFNKMLLKAIAEADYFLYNAYRIGVSTELNFDEVFFVRGGYCYTKNAPFNSCASVGLGFRYLNVELDAAYYYDTVIKTNSLILGLGFGF